MKKEEGLTVILLDQMDDVFRFLIGNDRSRNLIRFAGMSTLSVLDGVCAMRRDGPDGGANELGVFCQYCQNRNPEFVEIIIDRLGVDENIDQCVHQRVERCLELVGFQKSQRHAEGGLDDGGDH